ncbi:hypothetical protein JN01_0600 [Entomoplasma freundtii]|uniref:Uncharacterized protein n=1 Tax=Entomoplasma freundtii TaxID=74700 RepID=A0A2K8NRB3_9MOLU|nr:hypothetical protein [Entomoplasma freundtii]ATZ16359.1 hypothetical protein EFREU_v1c03330 [Entomoplasma freundtii]TDY56602.1 hypothetical protein JN01_0600 [Entomoplasma freundtii]
MSYYFKHSYGFTDHGLQRCRERLKLTGLPDYEVKEKIMDLIKNSNYSFESKYDLYIRAGSKGQLYFVISKDSNVIITCSPVSPEKQLSLMDY